MKLAIIDCGTNTFNLLILEIIDSKVQQKLVSTRESVKLGEGSINKGFIGEEAFQRALHAFELFNGHIQTQQTDHVLAYATSAIRDATNGWRLIAKVKEKFGISIDIINGLNEANFIFLGVNAAVKLSDDVSLIMDIGGGSVEFILAKKGLMLWKESFNVGVARILDNFHPSDPITINEINTIQQFLKEKLRRLGEAIHRFKPTELVGSSGAFESFIEMLAIKNLSLPLSDKTTEYDIECQNYLLLAKEIIHSSVEQRKSMQGLVPMRVDMIVISCIMVNFVLEEYNLSKLRVSSYSLKEGAVIHYINTSKKQQ